MQNLTLLGKIKLIGELNSLIEQEIKYKENPDYRQLYTWEKAKSSVFMEVMRIELEETNKTIKELYDTKAM